MRHSARNGLSHLLEEFVNKLFALVKEVWERAVTLALGAIPSLCLSPRKVTSPTATTGGASPIGCGREGCNKYSAREASDAG